MYVSIWKQLYTWIIGHIQLLTDKNIDTQLYTRIYSIYGSLHTLECANSYIRGLQIYTSFDTHEHVYTVIYRHIQLDMYVSICSQLCTYIIRYIQLLTHINIDAQLYTHIYNCIRTLASANSYIHGLLVYTSFDTH